VGFLLCGLSLILVWTIPLLIAGGILMVVAAAIALFYDILTDVVVDAPREETEEAYETPLHRLRMKARQRREDRSGRGGTSERGGRSCTPLEPVTGFVLQSISRRTP